MSDTIPFPKPPQPKPPEDDEDEEDGDEEPSRRSPLLVLVLIALLVVGGWFLANKLASLARVQDCVLSGRHNCAPIETPGGG